jgi:nucleotide-binding universal stress UspA family protein
VLLCVDGSDHARSAAACLASLPWVADCRVQVLGVNARGLDTTSAVDEAVEVLTRGGVREVHRRVIDAPPPTAAELDVREAVLAVIRSDAPDLVAVGARGAGGLEGLLVGSVTSTVVHHAPCSVLVARSG